jgi:TP901 family phage tail tape measure protein
MVDTQNLAIGISLVMRDAFTAQAMRASSAMGTLTGSAQRLATQQTTLARNTNVVGAAIGVGLVSSIGKFYKEAADFNYMIKYVGTLSDETGKSFDKLKNKAIEVGKSSTFSPDEVASGMRWMAQSGMKAVGIIESIGSAAQLAQATMTDIGGRGGAADWITNIAMGFNIPLVEKNIEKLANVLAKGANKSNTNLQEFGEGMKYTQATAHRMKMTLEETAAGIMIMANMGIQGSMAGTGMENMLRYATRAAGSKEGSKQANALNRLGLSQKDLKDVNGGLIPIGQMLDKVYQGISKLSTVDAQNAIVDIFGVRGARAVAIGQHIKTYRGYLEDLQKQDSYLKDTAKAMMDTDKGALLILEDTWKSFKIEWGTAIAPVVTPLIKGLTKIVSLFADIVSTPIGKFLAVASSGFLVIRTAQMIYRSIILSINLLKAQGISLMGNMGNTATGHYSRMTTAASGYASVLQRINMMTGAASSGAGSIGRYKHGGYYQVGPGGGYMPLKGGSYKIGMHRMGNFMSKGSIPAMLGGMGLGMMADSVNANGNTSLGGALNVGSNALSGMGMGAMVGSVIPGLGTAVGGLVGGVAGLIIGLTENINKANEDVKAKDEQVKSGAIFDTKKWQREVEMYGKMSMGQKAWLEYTSSSGSPNRDSKGSPLTEERLLNNSIVIQLNGDTVYDKNVYGRDVKEAINLGLN